jgi:hypothetical protein
MYPQISGGENSAENSAENEFCEQRRKQRRKLRRKQLPKPTRCGAAKTRLVNEKPQKN